MKIHYLLILFILASCSVANIAVSNLDWIIHRQVKNNLDLYYSQSSELDKDISSFLTRQIQKIPQIELLLDRLNKSTEKESIVTINNVIDFRKDISQIYIEIASDFNSNILAKFLALLDKKQISHFKDENNNKNKEIKENINKRDTTKFFERLEYFVGEFSTKQKQFLLSNEIHLRSLQEIRLIRRKTLQQDLYQIMLTSSDDKASRIKKRFFSYVKKTDVSMDMLKKINRHRKFIDQMIVNIFKEMSQKQKDFIKRRIKFIKNLLEKYKDSFSKNS